MLGDNDKKILALMKENSGITVSEISRRIGLGTTTITKHICRLRAQGTIERTGSKKNGQWIVRGMEN